MSFRLALHWAVVLAVAMAAAVVAPLPFTGPLDGLVGAVATVAVLAVGYATAPNPRKDRRP